VRKNLSNIKASARVSRMPFGFPERAGEKVEWTDQTLYDIPIADEYGVGGMMTEYFRTLESILRDHGVFLRSETTEEMFTP
jgi:hypothetical protein